MANITITNNDVGDVVLDQAESVFADEKLTFGGAGTVKKGAILARSTATLKLIPYVKGGSSNGNGTPCCVLTGDVVATGAGDVGVRPLMSGKVSKKRLVIHADGDDSNIDGAVLDALRARSIVAEDLEQLARYDNPQPTESDS